MKNGIRLAAVVFLVTWVPLSLWRGIAMGRALRLGPEEQTRLTPMIDNVIQMAFVMLAPALLLALLAFALWAWRDERRSARP